DGIACAGDPRGEAHRQCSTGRTQAHSAPATTAQASGAILIAPASVTAAQRWVRYVREEVRAVLALTPPSPPSETTAVRSSRTHQEAVKGRAARRGCRIPLVGTAQELDYAAAVAILSAGIGTAGRCHIEETPTCSRHLRSISIASSGISWCP